MLSTPFICCSSGVATDCSMVTASAPVYVVETIICGGMMSGNCATGSDLIATSPPNTVMMAITIATIGRSIKIREIILTTALQRNETRIHSDAGPDLLRAFNHDTLAGFQTVVDDPILVDLLADFNRTNTHLVVVAHDGDLIAALQLRHSTLRHH